LFCCSFYFNTVLTFLLDYCSNRVEFCFLLFFSFFLSLLTNRRFQRRASSCLLSALFLLVSSPPLFSVLYNLCSLDHTERPVINVVPLFFFSFQRQRWRGYASYFSLLSPPLATWGHKLDLGWSVFFPPLLVVPITLVPFFLIFFPPFWVVARRLSTLSLLFHGATSRHHPLVIPQQLFHCFLARM